MVEVKPGRRPLLSRDRGAQLIERVSRQVRGLAGEERAEGGGMMALKGARTRTSRTAAFIAALLTFGYIIGVAIAHDPAGWITLVR